MPDRKAVLLVDETGRITGAAGKIEAHESPGRLHLAFSVCVFRRGETLLQKRADSKYHFPGVWANACCSHPEPGEDLVASATARLRDELGVDCELRDVGTFVYRAVDAASGRVEHELDHVLVGELPDGAEPVPAPDEVSAVAWRDAAEVLGDASAGAGVGPAAYAPWLAEVLRLALAGRAGGGS